MKRREFITASVAAIAVMGLDYTFAAPPRRLHVYRWNGSDLESIRMREVRKDDHISLQPMPWRNSDKAEIGTATKDAFFSEEKQDWGVTISIQKIWREGDFVNAISTNSLQQ